MLGWMTIQPIPRIVIRGEQKRKFLWYQVIVHKEQSPSETTGIILTGQVLLAYCIKSDYVV
jgi:hypothetical protein